MNTKKGAKLGGLFAANPMAKFSGCAWSETACNNNGNSLGTNHIVGTYLSAGELNLSSRFSLNSSLALHLAVDPDATSSSTSSNSATNNSSSSLSVSPADRQSKQSTKHNNRTSNHLLELQREIKAEEDEIFADINSLINGRSILYSSLDDDDEDGLGDVRGHQSNILDDENLSSFKYSGQINFSTSNNQPDIGSNHTDEFFAKSGDEFNEYPGRGSNPITVLRDGCPSERIQASNTATLIDQQDRSSCRSLIRDNGIERTSSVIDEENNSLPLHDAVSEQEHEEIHHNVDEQLPGENVLASSHQDDQTNYQTIEDIIQQVTSNLPKPCVFFLEGNCRRSDCKYSHDLSKITCKYWIEGFCFKGEMCPFLHSYAPIGDLQDSNIDEDGLKSLSGKELNPTFVIESEADFPSLPLDAPVAIGDSSKRGLADAIATNIKNQILSSNPAVLFKTVKKKRKRG